MSECERERERLDVGLSDDDIVRRAVGVQLLVPLLDELVLDAGAMALFDACRKGGSSS